MRVVEITTKVKLTDAEVKFLKGIGENQEIEYRDIDFMTVTDFKKSEQYKDKFHTLDWFLSRNYGGTYKIALLLWNKGLLDEVGISWHDTLILSSLGRKVKRML